MEQLKKKIDDLLLELGFEEILINKKIFYKKGYSFYRISFVKGFNAFAIEYAENIEQVKKNLLEDGDIYPLILGEKKLLKRLREDLLKYYIDEC